MPVFESFTSCKIDDVQFCEFLFVLKTDLNDEMRPRTSFIFDCWWGFSSFSSLKIKFLKFLSTIDSNTFRLLQKHTIFITHYSFLTFYLISTQIIKLVLVDLNDLRSDIGVIILVSENLIKNSRADSFMLFMSRFSLNRVSFTTSCLSIGKDANIVSLKERFYKQFNFLVSFQLIGLLI